MMFVHELLTILQKKQLKYKKHGNCFYKDADGKCHVVDFVSTDSKGNLILSEYKEP